MVKYNMKKPIIFFFLFYHIKFLSLNTEGNQA